MFVKKLAEFSSHSRRPRFIAFTVAAFYSLFFVIEAVADSNNLVSAHEEALSFGQFIAQNNNSHYIITAPHGGYDLMTEIIVREVCTNILWSCLIAQDFRSKGHYINVTRPTEKLSGTSNKEAPTTRALHVYEEYLSQIYLLNKAPKLYVEVHGNSRNESKNRIEIATVGINGDQAKRVKLILQNAISSTKLTQSIAIENIDYIYYHATSSKARGSLSKIKPALHFEFPRNSRITSKDEVVAFLSLALPELALELFP